MSDLETATHAPLVTFSSRRILPPPHAYIGVDDKLVVMVLASVGGAFLVLNLRILSPDGQIIPHQHTITVTGAYTKQYVSFTLPEGFILSAVAYATGTATQRGQCFIQAFFQRGAVILGDPYEVILQGYVSTGRALTYPDSEIEDPASGAGAINLSITASNPVFTEFIATVPANAIWRVMNFSVTLVTSANAGSRQQGIALADAATAHVFWNFIYPFTQGPSLTFVYSNAIRGGSDYTAAVANHGIASLPECRLLAGWEIKTKNTNLTAGDQYTNLFVHYEEWLQP